MNTAYPELRLGTSSWSSTDWVGKFYAPGTATRDFIAAYARTFNSVEIDATFYAVPRRSTIEGWRDRTPPDFVFAAKAPQRITHEKFLVNAESDLNEFLEAMSILGPRLGPILFQFPYYARASGVTRDEFLRRLEAFLPKLPSGGQYAVEVRNKSWIGKTLLAMLHNAKIPLALIDHPWMSPPGELFARDGVLTGPFAYIRWLGDRYKMEQMTRTWNETLVDREADLQRWVPHILGLLERRFPIFAYVNNHYAGYAPGTVELLNGLIHDAQTR